MAELDRYHRVRLLLGDTAFAHLCDARVLLLGVGGVGGFCLDALIRSGITAITIVDHDTFELTNQNRQIGSERVGEVKVTRLHALYPSVTPVHVRIDETWVKNHDFSAYDIVIDAIDDMRAKVALALHVNTPLISSMGSAKRLDPTAIETDSVWKTQGDALAKKFRYELRKAKFNGNFPVVYSKELPTCKELGSFVGVTGAFGFTLASLAIKTLMETNTPR